MRFPQDLSPERFLANSWQKMSLHMPSAMERIRPEITPDELGWLATLEDVESRLVLTERDGDRTDYRVLHGPFAADELRKLPASDWTLLVQDVEKHLPDFRALLGAVSFVPDWRIDDLMVSVAAPGGSVGPHRDNYDVFLCQGTGTRRWRIARCDEHIPDRAHADLMLLEPFSGDEEFVSGYGDVLYLPPGIPHWGIADETCITYSIGMRAPTIGEVVDAFDLVAERELVVDETESLDFYRDPDLDLHEAEPGMISARAVERLRVLSPELANQPRDPLVIAFGVVVTGLKDWLRPVPWPAAESARIVAGTDADGRMPVHGMSRLAWLEHGGAGYVFVNGAHRAVSDRELTAFRELCRKRAACGDTWHFFRRDGAELLAWLLQVGAFDPQDRQAPENREICSPKNVT